jgi:hypothetical protein
VPIIGFIRLDARRAGFRSWCLETRVSWTAARARTLPDMPSRHGPDRYLTILEVPDIV